jgi:hypothetical protein
MPPGCLKFVMLALEESSRSGRGPAAGRPGPARRVGWWGRARSEREERLPSLPSSHRDMAISTASAVAMAIAGNPSANHCAPLSASAVCEVSVAWSWMNPAMTAAAAYASAGTGMIV